MQSPHSITLRCPAPFPATVRLNENFTLARSVISDNASPGGAAGVYAYISRVFASDTLFESNVVRAATPGGDQGVAIIAQGDRLSGMRSRPSMFCRDEPWCGSAQLQLRRCAFRNNTAYSTSAAAIYAGNPVFASVFDSAFEGNRAVGGSGGAIQFAGSYGMLNVAGSTFDSNSADRCGAVHVTSGGLVSLTGNTFARNTALNGAGGAVCVEKLPETVTTCDRGGAPVTIQLLSGDITPVIPGSVPPSGLGPQNCTWRVVAPWHAKCTTEVVLTHLTVASRATYLVSIEDGDTVRTDTDTVSADNTVVSGYGGTWQQRPCPSITLRIISYGRYPRGKLDTLRTAHNRSAQTHNRARSSTTPRASPPAPRSRHPSLPLAPAAAAPSLCASSTSWAGSSGTCCTTSACAPPSGAGEIFLVYSDPGYSQGRVFCVWVPASCWKTMMCWLSSWYFDGVSIRVSDVMSAGRCATCRTATPRCKSGTFPSTPTLRT